MHAAQLADGGAGAAANGLLTEYFAALDEINFRLTVEPREWVKAATTCR